ncbi:MAG TPA: TolC family protein [Candidatus Limnocylindria bacterium]|nr:TolC family protein [Candidatus Limnocylindria bacterium]
MNHFTAIPVSLLIIMLGATGLSTWAADTTVRADDPLSLKDALETAYLHNWDLLAAKAQVNLADAQRIVSREFPNPILAGSVSKINVNGQPAHTVDGNGFGDRSYDTIVAVNQLVEIGGKRQNRRESAVAGFEAAKARFAEARRQLDLGVAKAYVGVLLAEETSRVLRDSAGSLRQEATINAARLKAGDIATNDFLQIEVASSRLELDAQTAADAAVTARVQLVNLLGLPPASRNITLTDNLGGLLQASDEGSANSDGSAMATVLERPDVVAARKDIAKAEADLRLARSQRIPDPTFSFQWEHEPPDQNQTVGMGLSLPLPLWNRNRGAIAAAEANVAAAQASLHRLELAAAADLVIARNQLDTALRRQREYTASLVPKSSAVRESLLYAYQKGGASLIDLLSAQRTDNELRLAAAQASADAVNARIALRAALAKSKD